MMDEVDYFDQNKEINEITMKDLDDLGRQIFEQKKACEAVESILDLEKGKLHRMQTLMISILDKYGRSNFAIPGAGLLVKTERLTVSLPKTPEDKDAFYNYLKDKDVFEDLVTVNSMTLNAFYKKEFEIAAEEGRATGFKIPGISEPKTIVTLNMRKGK